MKCLYLALNFERKFCWAFWMLFQHLLTLIISDERQLLILLRVPCEWRAVSSCSFQDFPLVVGFQHLYYHVSVCESTYVCPTWSLLRFPESIDYVFHTVVNISAIISLKKISGSFFSLFSFWHSRYTYIGVFNDALHSSEVLFTFLHSFLPLSFRLWNLDHPSLLILLTAQIYCCASLLNFFLLVSVLSSSRISSWFFL